MTSSQPARNLGHLILTLRGQRVLLDSDLAALYGVSTGNLNKAVRRNLDRFPEDFMFQLHPEEAEALRFHSGISNKGRGGRRYLPYAFTQEGVAMLSSVLSSPTAVQVNIAIMRAFMRLRQPPRAMKPGTPVSTTELSLVRVGMRLISSTAASGIAKTL